MFDRKEIGEKATIVSFNNAQNGSHSYEMEEFKELVIAAGVEIASELDVKIRYPNARYLIGKGKLEELKDIVVQTKANLIIFDASLTPSQEKNLEQKLECRVVDRTGLILDIFAQRAKSFEGKLQVELAQLRHISTRLIRGWTHLERQKGGIGLRGPGETQLETDRRLIGRRIKQLNLRLDQVDKRRKMNQKNRARSGIPTVAIIGYTNAGKSTLFNLLTGTNQYTKDMLFATLDPVMRRLDIVNAGPIIVSDTVGFIRDLPHELIAAFKATLQEARDSDLILHVVDVCDIEKLDRINQVNKILKELGAENVPQLRVYNKIDKSEFNTKNDNEHSNKSVYLSAKTGEGVDKLFHLLRRFIKKNVILGNIKLENSQGRQRAILFQMGAVKNESQKKDGSWELTLEANREDINSFLKNEGIDKNNFIQIQ